MLLTLLRQRDIRPQVPRVPRLRTRKLRPWHLAHHFMANRWGNNANSDRFLFWGAPKSLQMVTAAMKLKDACSLEEKL